MTNQTCSSCRFFSPKGNECRRFPPVIQPWLVDNQTDPWRYDYLWSFPHVLPDHAICGEYKP